MGLPTTFVGFSSTDIKYYRLIQAWKKNENIDFNFRDCQLQDDINSKDEDYIKAKCRKWILIASKFIQLVGEDTRYKYKYVRWEAEGALEKGCTIIGVNLNGSKNMVERTCPPVIRDIGAVFVPYPPYVIKYAIENYTMHDSGNYRYKDSVYRQLGYKI